MMMIIIILIMIFKMTMTKTTMLHQAVVPGGPEGRLRVDDDDINDDTDHIIIDHNNDGYETLT